MSFQPALVPPSRDADRSSALPPSGAADESSQTVTNRRDAGASTEGGALNAANGGRELSGAAAASPSFASKETQLQWMQNAYSAWLTAEGLPSSLDSARLAVENRDASTLRRWLVGLMDLVGCGLSGSDETSRHRNPIRDDKNAAVENISPQVAPVDNTRPTASATAERNDRDAKGRDSPLVATLPVPMGDFSMSILSAELLASAASGPVIPIRRSLSMLVSTSSFEAVGSATGRRRSSSESRHGSTNKPNHDDSSDRTTAAVADDGIDESNEFIAIDPFVVVGRIHHDDALYLAKHRDTGVTRAIKEIVGVAGKAQRQEQVLLAATKLKHRHIVRVHEVIDDRDSPNVYLVMQYAAGGPIGVMAGDGTCAASESHRGARFLLRALYQAASALRYVHAEFKTTYGDVRPEKVLLDEKGDVLMAHFGVAEASGDSATAVPLQGAVRRRLPHGISRKRCKPPFTPPENFENYEQADLNLAGDVWSLGVTFYALYYGRLPFAALDGYDALRAAVVGQAIELRERGDSAEDAAMVRALRAMLHKDPSRRCGLEALRTMLASFAVDRPKAESTDASKRSVVT